MCYASFLFSETYNLFFRTSRTRTFRIHKHLDFSRIVRYMWLRAHNIPHSLGRPGCETQEYMNLLVWRQTMNSFVNPCKFCGFIFHVDSFISFCNEEIFHYKRFQNSKLQRRHWGSYKKMIGLVIIFHLVCSFSFLTLSTGSGNEIMSYCKSTICFLESIVHYCFKLKCQ